MTRLETIEVHTLDHVTGGNAWAQMGLNVAGAAIKGAAAGDGQPIRSAARSALQALAASWPGGGKG